MANVFLLGNGFDLHHGLPTKYENFLHTVHFLRDHYDKSIDTVGKVFGNDFFRNCDKTITDSYNLYKSAYDTTPLYNTIIKDLSKKAKENYWFKYLLSSFDKDRGWIDFEKEIAKVLKAFEKMFTTKGVLKKQYGNVILDLYDLYNEVFEYIIKRFDFFFTHMSVGHEDVNKEYTIEVPHGSGNKEIDKEKVIGDLYKSLEELSEMLKSYLTYFVDKALEQMISQNIAKRNRVFEEEGYVISFNYTKTIELLYNKGVMYNENIAHIHGKNSDSIVLGINPDGADDIETVDTSFIQFKKYYQRVVNNTDHAYMKILRQLKNEKELYENKLTMYVVGHSLDVTDEDIIKELFDRVSEIRILYYDDNDKKTKVKNLVSIYGKEEFDRIRYEKKLTFLPLGEINKSSL